MSRILALLNARAGTILDHGADRIRDALREALSARGEAEVRVIPPKELIPAIRAAAQSDADTIVIGGGDGSVGCAVHTLSPTQKTLGVLPLGTINLLARDLGMPLDPQQAIAALADAQPRTIDLASINGRVFHSLSGLGFFSQMARAREEVRGHPLGRLASVAIAAIRAIRRTGGFALDLVVDGRHEPVEALAVLVTNNRFDARWRRPRLDEGTLELHIAENAGGLSRLKASAGMLTGTWREGEGIRSLAAQSVTIARRRRRSWAATDGELNRERMPLHYEIRPRALTVLAVPQKESESSPFAVHDVRSPSAEGT